MTVNKYNRDETKKFNIDIETCNEYGSAIKVIACIEDPTVIDKILTYLKRQKSDQSLNAYKSLDKAFNYLMSFSVDPDQQTNWFFHKQAQPNFQDRDN